MLIVTGCLAQRFQKDIFEEIPEVDAVVGTTSYDEIVSVIDKALEGEKIESFKSIDYLPRNHTERVITTGGYFSYLKIAEGCDKHCSYCIIPSLQWRLQKRADGRNSGGCQKALQRSGVKELNIVAQETTMYGKDLYGKKTFHILLNGTM